MATLRQMYGWAFSPEKLVEGYVRPDARLIDGPFFYGDLKTTPLPVEHASVETIGFRFDFPGARSLAYISDVKRIPAATMALLAGVDVLVVDALRTAAHPTHFSLSEALAAIEEAGSREAWLTHMTHDFDYETLAGQLPPGVRPAWDGLRISL